MIIITGAAGFIGSNLLKKLNNEGYHDIVLVDDFSNSLKNKNIEGKIYTEKIAREHFFEWLKSHHRFVQFIFHIGARTDTTEMDHKVFEALNVNYSKKIWEHCIKYGLPLVYASSAATYGLGEKGFEDDHEIIDDLKPLNPYGKSKNDFDKWVLQQKDTPYYWSGLKFFNVYGPNEYHKGRMASVVYHAYKQIRDTGEMKLFRSHHPDYKDGEQSRDFIYVKDVADVLFFCMHNRKENGIYNLGTGTARTFYDLVTNIFNALGKKKQITFIDTPEDIRNNYQYFTQANMKKLRLKGYDKQFITLEEGIKDYIENYLVDFIYY